MGEVSDRLTAVLSGRYAIEREVGAGGMATVYLAKDLRHGRKVALKVLRPELAAILGPERFLAEIQVTANLQHPHLLPLFDSGEADGQLFYVMPFIEGESLRARLERERQLPVEEAIRIAAAVAEGLDYAHRHGVVHRDLKPENILLNDGKPVVADFGIALAVSKAGGARITQTGLSLGTPAYMSPEQATGDRQVDARSDIYSLSALTYEMLVGDPPHAGSTTQAVIAKVLTERAPSARALRDTVPGHVDAALQKGLAKLPADRFASAEEFAAALTGTRPFSVARPSIKSESVAITPANLRRDRLRTVAASVILTTAALFGLSTLLRGDPGSVGAPSLFEITFSDSIAVTPANSQVISLTRDGSQLAFRGTSGGTSGLYIRRLSQMDASFVRGTEGGTAPHFSPDGSWLLFAENGGRNLRKVPVGGGQPITVADSTAPNGSSWGDNDDIVFTRGEDNGSTSLWRTSGSGSPPTLLAQPDSKRGHVAYRWPHLMPGGKAALITLWKGSTAVEDAELGVVNLDDGEITEIGIVGVSGRYVPTGHIVFARADGSVFAAPFSLRRLRTTGPSVPVLEGANVSPRGRVDLAISTNGTLVYVKGESLSRLVTVGRNGTVETVSQDARVFRRPRVSPDGQRIAVEVASRGTAEIWIQERADQTLTRLTFGGGMDPLWTPDGRGLLFSRVSEAGDFDIHVQPADNSGPAEPVLVAPEDQWAFAWSADGRRLVFDELNAENDIDIRSIDLVTKGASTPFAATAAWERLPTMSPDGRWLAYASDESGQFEIYVRPFPGPGGQVRISTAGGNEPIWSPNGREIFYRDGTSMIAVEVRTQPSLSIVSRRSLFADGFAGIGGSGASNYDVLSGGEAFVMLQPAGAPRLMAVTNWFEQLRAAVGVEVR
jgi:serine/threonine protein kinase